MFPDCISTPKEKIADAGHSASRKRKASSLSKRFPAPAHTISTPSSELKLTDYDFNIIHLKKGLSLKNTELISFNLTFSLKEL